MAITMLPHTHTYVNTLSSATYGHHSLMQASTLSDRHNSYPGLHANAHCAPNPQLSQGPSVPKCTPVHSTLQTNNKRRPLPLSDTHKTVNHRQNFVDPITGAHTQAIKGHWLCTKSMMRKQGVMNTSSDLFPSYMVECHWRRRYGDSDLFEKLMEHNYQRKISFVVVWTYL